MKHTKKLLAAVMAFAMVSAIAPMSAFATNVTPDTDGKPSPATAGFEVKYDVDPSYTVTIPAGVDITTGDKTASITLDEGALLAEGTKIEVVLEKGAYTTTGNAFTAKTASGNSSASYQINGGNVKVGDVVASLDKDTLSADLTFSRTTTIAPTYAGTHSEVLTFGIAVKEAVKAETLLTTLTFGGSSTYSETTSGVVSVTATNVTDYDATFGWLWYREGSLSVTAKEGYTITKCVFIQNAKTPITDTEAPFEIHSTRGKITEDTKHAMDGVTSIEVYGYAN